MNKKETERELIFKKTNGRCAYCGCELKTGWHLDHVIPARRDFDRGKLKKINYKNKELDSADNKFAACPSCNINKHSMPIEEFRLTILKFVDSLNERIVQYKIAKRFGLITETNKKIVFYFEEIKK